MCQSVRCTVSGCSCVSFTPGCVQLRSCDRCGHGWVAHGRTHTLIHTHTAFKSSDRCLSKMSRFLLIFKNELTEYFLQINTCLWLSSWKTSSTNGHTQCRCVESPRWHGIRCCCHHIRASGESICIHTYSSVSSPHPSCWAKSVSLFWCFFLF